MRTRTLTALRVCCTSVTISRLSWTNELMSNTSRFRPVSNIQASIFGSARVQNCLSVSVFFVDSCGKTVQFRFRGLCQTIFYIRGDSLHVRNVI